MEPASVIHVDRLVSLYVVGEYLRLPLDVPSCTARDIALLKSGVYFLNMQLRYSIRPYRFKHHPVEGLWSDEFERDMRALLALLHGNGNNHDLEVHASLMSYLQNEEFLGSLHEKITGDMGVVNPLLTRPANIKELSHEEWALLMAELHLVAWAKRGSRQRVFETLEKRGYNPQVLVRASVKMHEQGLFPEFERWK